MTLCSITERFSGKGMKLGVLFLSHSKTFESADSILSLQNKNVGSQILKTVNTKITIIWSRDSAVGVATGYGLDGRGVGVRVPVYARLFFSPRCPDRFRGSLSLLFNGYRGLLLWRLRGRGVKLTTHLQLVPRSRICGSIHPLPHTSSWRGA
jgi:hypothetical protein